MWCLCVCVCGSFLRASVSTLTRTVEFPPLPNMVTPTSALIGLRSSLGYGF